MIALYRKTVAYGGLTFLGVVTASTRYLSFGKLINFNRTIVSPVIARIMLKMVGVDIRIKLKQPETSVCYFYNHNSYLDIFIIPLLGLKNTRYIITEGIKKILPLHLCNLGIEVLYIPDTDKTEERIAFFKQVSEDLRANKYSVLCSPEGRHDWIHGIGAFNRGVFHMAIAAKVPIQTLFFNIPREANPMQGPDMRPCEVLVEAKEFIETSQWTEEEVEIRKQQVRARFLEYYHDAYGDYGESKLS